MSRSGYTDDCDNWELIKWRGAVASAIRGQRGQALLREMAAALDAMEVKELIAHDLENLQGCCALGAVGRARRLDMRGFDPDGDEYEARYIVAGMFDIAPAMAAEIMEMNNMWRMSPTERWQRMRAWVQEQIR